MPPPRRILVRGVNWLGDAVMTTPALLRLREHLPQTHVTLLTPAKLQELWLQHPALNEFMATQSHEGLLSVGRKLRQRQFDLALVLPNSPRSALEVWLAGIPRRIGYARPWRNGFLTRPVPTRPGHAQMRKRTLGEIKRLVTSSPTSTRDSRLKTQDSSAHQIHEYLHLTASLGANPEPLAPTLAVSSEEIYTAKNKFGLDQITSPLLGLNPGAEYGSAKRWPVDCFVAAAREIQRQTKCIWLILGASGDAELAERVSGGLGRIAGGNLQVLNLAGKTSLRELMTLLKMCRVLLTNDTGPMHVAAALGTPVVVPFGSTSPELTGPGLPGDARHHLLESDAACSPCFRRNCPIDFRCMTGIGVERVIEAVVDALKW